MRYCRGRKVMMRNDTFRKSLVVAIIVLFICMSIKTSIGTKVIKKSTLPISNGNTLYVGGSGPGNYTSIQDAINDANTDSTVFVFAYSSPYYENVVVNKSINLIGENKDTTIIDGNHSGNCVYVTADYVDISGFTIQNGKFWGIYLETIFNRITDNNILNNEDKGIALFYSSGNTIIGNTILNNLYEGINLYRSNYNTINGNTILNNLGDGISLHESNRNTITDNIISNNEDGIRLGLKNGGYSAYNTITGNNITSNKEKGIKLYEYTDINIIYHNNFINNTQNAYNEGNNTWDDGKYGNYWSDYEERYPDAKKKPLRGIWDTPYEILGGENKDRCPLIKQWPKTRTRNTQYQTIAHPVFHWFLERFPLPEAVVSRIINL